MATSNGLSMNLVYDIEGAVGDFMGTRAYTVIMYCPVLSMLWCRDSDAWLSVRNKQISGLIT